MSTIKKSGFTLRKEKRENQEKQKGIVLWFTGLSASGKTTIANELEKLLYKNDNHSYILDGDVFRDGLSSDLTFDRRSREENLRRVKYVAEMFCDAGIITLVTFISPFQKDREKVRSLLKSKYIEIYVCVSLQVAEDRDPKGLYKKARSGEIKDFTGIDSPYDIPLSPEITLLTEKDSASLCAKQVFEYLVNGGFVIRSNQV